MNAPDLGAGAAKSMCADLGAYGSTMSVTELLGLVAAVLVTGDLNGVPHQTTVGIVQGLLSGRDDLGRMHDQHEGLEFVSARFRRMIHEASA